MLVCTPRASREKTSMSLILFVVLPAALFLMGKLAGLAVAAGGFYSVCGKRLGETVGRWTSLALPAAYLAAMLLGAEGDAGHGVTLFGSADLLDAIGAVVYYGMPALALFAGAVYVVRDLTLGHIKDAPPA
jgi:hypothetical protein